MNIRVGTILRLTGTIIRIRGNSSIHCRIRITIDASIRSNSIISFTISISMSSSTRKSISIQTNINVSISIRIVFNTSSYYGYYLNEYEYICS